MIKYLLPLFLIFAGCALDTETVDDYDETAAYDGPEQPDWPGWNTSPNHNYGCHSEAFEMLNGSVMIIPGLCAPFYIYMGYPDPTEEPDNSHNNEQQFSQPNTKEQ